MQEKRVALITGASGGIGHHLAASLGRHGLALALHGRRGDELAELAGELANDDVPCLTVTADLRDPTAARALVAHVEEQWGRLDVLVNNAGVTRDGLCWKLSPEDWDETLAVNLTAPFHLCAAALPGMRERRWGRVLNIGSVVGSHGIAGASAYAASKTGLLGFTRSLAKEVARRGITANYLELGYFSTGIIGTLSEQQLAWVRDRIPVGELGPPGDVGDLCAFLCSDSGRYLTGQAITIAGGFPT